MTLAPILASNFACKYNEKHCKGVQPTRSLIFSSFLLFFFSHISSTSLYVVIYGNYCIFHIATKAGMPSRAPPCVIFPTRAFTLKIHKNIHENNAIEYESDYYK